MRIKKCIVLFLSVLVVIIAGVYLYNHGLKNSPQKVFGYIGGISNVNTKNYLVFKQYDFLQGSAADEAARQYGSCFPSNNGGCSAPDGYFIRSTTIATATVEISPNVKINLLKECGVLPMTVTLATFRTYLKQNTTDYATYCYTHAGYWIQSDSNGLIDQIDQQYVP